MNKVTNWTYEKPTQEGIYLCCYGDVETPYNVWLANFNKHSGLTSIDFHNSNAESFPHDAGVKYALFDFNDE